MGELASVRLASRRLTAALFQRDAAIVAAVAAGHSLREVAQEAGLTHSGVAKIIARNKEADR